MSRWGGRVVAVTTVLVAALLVEAEAAQAAPGSTPPVARSAPVAAPTTSAVPVPSPALAAQAAFGTTGTLVVQVQPVDLAGTPGTRARGSAGSWSAGDVDRPFPTASLVKLYLAEGVLAAARASGAPLGEDDRQRIAAALTSSDDQAASELWVIHDGPGVLADVAARYGLRGTAAPTPDPGAWGSTTTTAADLARFLVELPHRAHPDDAAWLLGLLRSATPLGADGFDQSFGLLGPGRTPGAAAKQGWMCCTDGLRHLHSIGVADGEVVVLLAEFPVEVDWPAARAALDAAATAISR